MKNLSLKTLAVPTLLIATVAIGGYGTTTSSRAGSDALMGAAGGALIGSLSANAGAGALIGLGVGALDTATSTTSIARAISTEVVKVKPFSSNHG